MELVIEASHRALQLRGERRISDETQKFDYLRSILLTSILLQAGLNFDAAGSRKSRETDNGKTSHTLKFNWACAIFAIG